MTEPTEKLRGPETVVDLVYKIGERLKVLGNERIDALRIHVGTADTPAGAIRESKHLNRGELLEQIITEEFEDDAKKLDESLQ